MTQNLTENDILGFDASQLSIFDETPAQQSGGNMNIYHPKPALSKSEDSVYRATIRLIYNPFDLRNSILEQQSYAIHDANGWLTLTSSLTKGDKNCPIFKAWKQCHYSKDSAIQAQAKYFDKRFGRYVTIQVIEDSNQPELQGKYMIWKMPKFIWEQVTSKMNPSPESKKPSIPIMDFLFGRPIYLEVTPGPDDKAHPERRTRETSYSTSEIASDEILSCTNPDGSPLLTPEQQTILDTYVNEMTTRVWKERDPEKRKVAQNEINAEDNTKQLRSLYRDVIEKIKTFCPNIEEEVGYKEWTDDEKARVDAWIKLVLAGQDPSLDPGIVPNATPTVTQPAATPAAQPTATATDADNGDLPF